MSKLLMFKSRNLQQRGFSLLEILVAFTILAISVGVILNIFSSGVQAAFLAEEYTIAVQKAESLLAEVGVETDLQDAGSQSGGQGEKFQWQVDVSPSDLNIEGLDDQTLAYQTYLVIVRVFWQAGENEREVVLQTLKLGELPQ